jgi:signal transduction histidine kinase
MGNAMLDKLVLCILCTVVYSMRAQGYYAVVPILAAVTLGALSGYVKNAHAKLWLFIGYSLFCIFSPQFILFVPVLGYEVPAKYRHFLLIAAFPAIAAFNGNHLQDGILMLVLLLLGTFMKYRAETLEKAQNDYIHLRDSTKELSMRLSGKNKNLMEKQDYEIRVATLNERNRIARDIHDGVGHLLSSAILQVGALMATCSDTDMKNRLETVKNTLSNGMDSIRVSVHELYDESIDLHTEIKKMIENFSFCPVNFDYHMDTDPDRNIKFAFIAVTGEALSNVTRHSNATAVSITLREHPILYQLVIKDNGTVKKKGSENDDEKGIGLKNISDRIADLGGILNISHENGFKIFISVPKEHANV